MGLVKVCRTPKCLWEKHVSAVLPGTVGWPEQQVKPSGAGGRASHLTLDTGDFSVPPRKLFCSCLSHFHADTAQRCMVTLHHRMFLVWPGVFPWQDHVSCSS